jgi:dipeptidase E
MSNQIYLAGGGNEHQSFVLDEIFFKQIPLNSKLLYIPIALKGHDLYAGAPKWLRGFVNLHNRQDIEIETWESLFNKSIDDLESFSTIFIGGGNTWNLMQEIRESGFDSLLKDFSKNIGPIYGGSAGAIIFGKKMNSQDDENLINWSDYDGLDMAMGLSVACHYKLEEKERYLDWAFKNKLPLLCLSEETGIIINIDDTFTCSGTTSCFIFTKDKKIIEIPAGFKYLLKDIPQDKDY